MLSGSSNTFNATDQTWRVNRSDAFIVKAAMRRATFGSVWAGVLLTLVISLILLSTSQQRRGIIFYIQCMSFPMALIYNALCIVYAFWEQQNIFMMPNQSGLSNRQLHLQVTTLSLEHWVPLLSDSALLFKFSSFYPPIIYSSLERSLRLGPLVLLFIPRLVMTIIFTYAAALVYLHPKYIPGQARPIFSTDHLHLLLRTGTAEFALQAPYCLYAAAVLLYKTLSLRRNSYQHKGSGIYRRLRFFMETIFMTFLPPAAFSIACAIQMNCPTTKYCAFRELSGTNLNLTVAFSLLATSWSTIRSRGTAARERATVEEGKHGQDQLLISKICHVEGETNQWSSGDSTEVAKGHDYYDRTTMKSTKLTGEPSYHTNEDTSHNSFLRIISRVSQ